MRVFGGSYADGESQDTASIQDGASEQHLPRCIGSFDERVCPGIPVWWRVALQSQADQVQGMRGNNFEAVISADFGS